MKRILAFLLVAVLLCSCSNGESGGEKSSETTNAEEITTKAEETTNETPTDPLDAPAYMYGANEITYREYQVLFVDSIRKLTFSDPFKDEISDESINRAREIIDSRIKTILVYLNEADIEGITLTDEEIEEIEGKSRYGFPDDESVEEYYGKGITYDAFLAFEKKSSLANKWYNSLLDENHVSEYVSAHPDDFKSIEYVTLSGEKLNEVRTYLTDNLTANALEYLTENYADDINITKAVLSHDDKTNEWLSENKTSGSYYFGSDGENEILICVKDAEPCDKTKYYLFSLEIEKGEKADEYLEILSKYLPGKYESEEEEAEIRRRYEEIYGEFAESVYCFGENPLIDACVLNDVNYIDVGSSRYFYLFGICEHSVAQEALATERETTVNEKVSQANVLVDENISLFKLNTTEKTDN